MKKIKIVVYLLGISALNLALMIPGGFIESRDFSHISPIILLTFNIFLTLLGMISLLIIYFVIKKQKWALNIAFVCGFSYFVVYIIDLIKLFPKSPTPMPLLLLLLEVLGSFLAIALMFYSALSIKIFSEKTEVSINKKIYLLIIFVILLSIGIIFFATNAAMGGF